MFLSDSDNFGSLFPKEGPLQLQPGPIYAKDGDKNRNEQISYKILKGDTFKN